MACSRGPAPDTPRAFPVALGMAHRCHLWQHRACWGKPCTAWPSRLAARGSTSAGGMLAPCRKQADAAAAAGWRGCHRPLLMPWNRWGELLLTCSHRPAGALVLQPPALLLGIAAPGFLGLLGSGAPLRRLSLKAMTPGALPS